MLELLAWGEAQRDDTVRTRLNVHYAALTQSFAKAIDRARGATQLFPTPKGERSAAALVMATMGALARSAVLGPADNAALAAALVGFVP